MASKNEEYHDGAAGTVRKEYVRCTLCGAIYNVQRGHSCRSH